MLDNKVCGPQEDNSLLVLIRGPTAEEESGLPPGALPAGAAKRKRTSILPGSAIRLEPLPPGCGMPSCPGCPLAHGVTW
jgi:hypothetical protein